jgi:hypothetical protein
MIKTITKRLTLLSLSFALVVGSNVGRADDIEIYFNSADAANNTDIIRSNVLFILDSSNSMRQQIPGAGMRRIDALKNAMEVVLNNIRDVNVGLMRFNQGNSGKEGGPVIFPI